jgi:glycine dehydrogenase
MKGEHEVTRFMTTLSNKDITLCNSMIPLGSCTMKLNSAYQLDQLSSPKMNIHPFAPVHQA